MKRCLYILIAIVSVWMTAGCAMLASVPRMAHVQITGPGGHINEVTIPLEPRRPGELDISLSRRTALQLHLQWLWYEKEDFYIGLTDGGDITRTPLIPWIIGKYRF